MKLHPEYLHVLLNPIPVYGLAMGLLALIIAFVLRSRAARIVALALICLSSAAALPVYHYGEKAYDDVMMITDDEGTKWMDEHKRRAESLIGFFYALSALSFAALVIPRKWLRSEVPLNAITLVFAVAVLGVGGWIAFAGGRIRHEEFRSGKLPVAAKPKGVEQAH
jgi:dolichol kinase